MTHTGFRRIIDVTTARPDGQPRSNVIGRPRKVTSSIVESVVSLALNDGSISIPRLSQIIRSQTGVMLCQTSIRKIRHGKKLSWSKANKCPLLTHDHICARL
jgi:transposase